MQMYTLCDRDGRQYFPMPQALLPVCLRLLPNIISVCDRAVEKWSDLERRSWSSGDQLRVNSAMALLRLGPEIEGMEKTLASLLGDKCGYVDGFSVEGLLRIQTKSATETVISYLQAHRWDDTLIRNIRTF